MKTLALETASPELADLVAGLGRGEELVFTDHAKPVAKLITLAASSPATPEMLQRRAKAFAELREMNLFREMDDPVAWQREIRRDRPLPGRE